ncbi:hypothetical protein I4U23_002255 [Adineta vaga]|nr:hypothetical protein I4U23_002255 [Adineta vaga]
MSTEIIEDKDGLLLLDKISKETITNLLLTGPPLIKSPQDAANILFDPPKHHLRSRINYEVLDREVTDDDLDIAADFGRFPYRPSNLFLKLFHNVLCTLRRNPLSGCVSPSLIGTSGVIPLTIISTIPDIMQHYYHCIIHAQKEVLLATNFWEKSESVNIIGKALRDLSKRAEKEDRYIIVKIMIDHPTKENIINFHHILPTDKWSDYDIPSPEEIPNISLQVNNYHRIIMGTFHAKFMIVDRRIALLNSNNIQDRPNLEMMSHFEGDIVNSFYDTFLISWWVPFEPNVVCLNDPARIKIQYRFGMNNVKILSVKQPLQQAIARARLRLQCHLKADKKQTSGDGFSSVAIKALVNHRQEHSPGVLVKAASNLAGAVIGYELSPRSESPLTLHLNKSSKSARETKSDENLTNEELENLSYDFSPFIFHQEHKPIPIALVNRSPHGTPGHIDTANPQDAAWIGAFRYAKKSIFIQSPTLNASPAIDGIIDACRRGIIVTLWLDLGFNDLTEGCGTFQGGTNESVVKKLYKKLREGNDGADKYPCFLVYWKRSNSSSQFLSKETELSY